MHRITNPWSTIHCFGGTSEGNGTFVPRTGWISTANVVFVKWVFEFVALMTNLNMKFAFQTADSETSVQNPIVLGSATTSDGFNRGAATGIGSDISNHPLVRFGFWTWNSQAANTLVCASAGGYVEYSRC